MGLLQKAVETYDSHMEYASIYRENSTMIAPISHTIANAMFEITINADGQFSNAAKVGKDDVRTVIPVTVLSAGRTSNDCPHPLCDQLSYIAPFNEIRHQLYLDQLSDWAHSDFTNPKITAILSYVRGGTVITDLDRCHLLKFDEEGIPKEKNGLIRWRVLGDDIDACWLDHELMNAYIQYDRCQKDKLIKVLDMVSGENQGYLEVHPRGIVPKYKSAKIISSDDNEGFTFRGRFILPQEAVTVGIDSSQKAHNALRWLVENQGVRAGDRVFLCWNPQGRSIPHMMFPLVKNKGQKFRPTEYKESLYKTLLVKRSELGEKAGVVITAFDATTDNTGRLSVTYYNELCGSDFLQRLYDWDKHCCWYYGWQEEIQSPRLEDIINCAFGRLKNEKKNLTWETDKKLARQWMQVLITCRVEKMMIPWELVSVLVDRASSPERFESQDKDGFKRSQILSTACAVVKKYRYDRYKEEWEMALEPEKMERSYQFGRLMAVFEKIERSTFRKSEREHKTTYTIRYQNAFCNKPFATTVDIYKHLEEAYIPRLSVGSQLFYKDLIGEIMEMLSRFPREELNKKLSETYLLGYYLQRNALNNKSKNIEEEEKE